MSRTGRIELWPGAIRTIGAAAVTALLLVACTGQDQEAQAIDPRVIEAAGDAQIVEVELVDVGLPVMSAEPVGTDIWLEVASTDQLADERTGDRLHRFDTVSASVTQRIDFPPGFSYPAYLTEGSVHVYRQLDAGAPPLDGVSVSGDEALFDSDDYQVVVEIDLETGEAVSQYVIPGPLFVNHMQIDDRWLWYDPGGPTLVRLDLQTGETVLAEPGPEDFSAKLIEGYIWRGGDYRMEKIDPSNGEVVLTVELEAPTNPGEFDDGEFLPGFHDDRGAWLGRGKSADDYDDHNDGVNYLWEFNLETGEIGDKFEAPERFSSREFTAANIRWVEDNRNDYHRYEADTGELLGGNYWFGSFPTPSQGILGFRPVAELNDYLWLVSGEAFGRAPLTALEPAE